MESANTALITDPMALFGFLAALVALIFWVSELPRFKKFFEFVPPVIFVYFVPMLTTTAGITPGGSVLYDWCSMWSGRRPSASSRSRARHGPQFVKGHPNRSGCSAPETRAMEWRRP